MPFILRKVVGAGVGWMGEGGGKRSSERRGRRGERRAERKKGRLAGDSEAELDEKCSEEDDDNNYRCV